MAANRVLIGTLGGQDGAGIDSYPATIGTHTDTTTGSTFNLVSGRITVQATSDGASFTSATITIQVSNDNDANGWLTLGTITLSGDNDTGGFAADAPWAYIRSNPTAFSGTGTVNVTMGI